MSVGTNTSFKRPDGKSCPAHYSEPNHGGTGTGIVLIQEWWGVNDQIKGVGERLRRAGYNVLIPDLYRGEVALDAAEAGHRMEGLDFADAASQDIRGAVQHMKANGFSEHVAAVGFCMGGVLAVLAAMQVPELNASVSWYGIPPADAGDPGGIKIPLQCHFALQDEFFPPDQADALEEKLTAGGVTHECYRYDARHAFFNQAWDKYDAESAELAWTRTLAFLRRYM